MQELARMTRDPPAPILHAQAGCVRLLLQPPAELSPPLSPPRALDRRCACMPGGIDQKLFVHCRQDIRLSSPLESCRHNYRTSDRKSLMPVSDCIPVFGRGISQCLQSPRLPPNPAARSCLHQLAPGCGGCSQRLNSHLDFYPPVHLAH